MSHKIYVLVDPREPEHVRYVGYTSQKLGQRLRGHIKDAALDNHKGNWVNSLLEQGVRPDIRLYKEVGPDWSQAEIDAIKHFRDLGHALTNGTDGGDGFNFTFEDRSNRTAKRWADQEYRETMVRVLVEANKQPENIRKNVDGHIRTKAFELDQKAESVRRSGYDPDTHKRCSRCNDVKLKSRFSALARSSDGLHYVCRDCINLAAKKYRR